METVEIVIADDHQLFIAGLKTLLVDTDKYHFKIVGVAHTGQSLLDLLKKTHASLLILDMNMPERDGLDVLAVIKEQYPRLRILTLTMYDESKIVKSAFKAGVDGYILKTIGISELMDAIETVLSGKTYMGKGVRLNAADANQNGTNGQFEDKFIKKYNLTKREIEILRLITQAMSNKEIAKELYISDQTVSVHRKNIMRKLGVSNTAGLIKVAYDHSLV